MFIFENISDQDKMYSLKDLINDSTPRPSFFFLVALSGIMATCGLLINNSAVIIASMLIAPILSPILSLALGISTADGTLIYRSTKTLIKSSLWAIGFSAFTTWFLWNIIYRTDLLSELTPEIIERIQPSFIYFLIAIVAGAATAFARVKPELSETLPGTAIAVALVPPLATIGIGIATVQMSVISGASAMFLLNAVGIIVAAIVMFSFMNLSSKKRFIERSVKEADQELQHKIALSKNNHKK
jgi:uncharacterized hydrophobic protein (TIGR00271 family)